MLNEYQPLTFLRTWGQWVRQGQKYFRMYQRNFEKMSESLIFNIQEKNAN